MKASVIFVTFALLLTACGLPATAPTAASSRPARPVAGKQLYLGISNGAAMLAIDPRTLEDLPGPPLLSVADSSHSSFVVSADGATGAVMDYSYQRVTSPAVRVDLSCGRLDMWSGPPLLGPFPGPGTPSDCNP